MKKKIIWLVVVVIVVVGGCRWLRRGGANGPAEPLAPEVIDVERGDLRVTVEATGRVVANATVEVKSKASGEILRLPFEAGDRVSLGDLLVELDPDDERRNVQQAESRLLSVQARLAQAESHLVMMESDSERILTQAEANLSQAQARFDDAEARYVRRQGLEAEGVLSEEELEAARTSFEEARSSLQTSVAEHADAQTYPLNIELRRQDIILAETDVRDAEIDLEQAEERFEDTRIMAPASGIITDLQIEVGQIIASGISNVGGGTALMEISDLSRMFIEVKVDETDIGKVRVGQTCEITADAFPERTLPGVVEWIAPQGVEESNITSFDVKVEINLDEIDEDLFEEIAQIAGITADSASASALTLSDWGLRPNMTARVEIICADLEDVVLLASEAIQRGKGSERYVELVVDEASAEAAAAQASPEDEEVATPTSRPSRSGPPPNRGGRPPSGRGGGPPEDDQSDEDLGIVIEEGPPTMRRVVRLGATDGINTHITSGLEGGEEVLIPIPEWRLEFLREQARGDEGDNRRRRRRL